MKTFFALTLAFVTFHMSPAHSAEWTGPVDVTDKDGETVFVSKSSAKEFLDAYDLIPLNDEVESFLAQRHTGWVKIIGTKKMPYGILVRAIEEIKPGFTNELLNR